MNKKLLIILSLVMVLVFGFAACGSNETMTDNTDTDDVGKNDTQKEETKSSDEPEQEEVTLNIFQFKVEAKDALESAVEAYMSENPHVHIDVKTVGGGDDYGAALRSQFSSGNEPTIYNVGGLQDAYDWEEKLEDLSNEPWIDLAFSGTLDAVTINGKIVGMPFNQEGYGLIYNKRIFEEAGIDASKITTYAALEEAVKTIDAKKDELGLKAVFAFPAKETWVTGLHLANVQFANEFSSVKEAFEAETIEMPYADAWKKLLDLQADYAYQPDGTKGSLVAVDYSTQVEELFSLEQVAIIQQGNWAYGGIASVDEEVAKNTGLLPMPLEGVVEDSIPVGIPMYWAINSNAEDAQKDAAKDFLNWLYTSDEGKERIINDFMFIPAFKGYEGLEPSDPLAKDILEYSNNGKTMPWVFMGYPTGWGQDKLGADIQAYLGGELTWDELIENAKTTWQELR